MTDLGDPLSIHAGERPRRASVDPHNTKGSSQSDFQAELQSSDDPSKVLAGWCVEGRPRITAALADEGSLLKLAAQLLCETTARSFGASALDKNSTELQMLRAAFSLKIGHAKEAATAFRIVATSPETPSSWRRRAYAALGWSLVNLGDFKGCVRSALLSGQDDPNLEPIDQYAMLIASSRIRVEIGDPEGARKDLLRATQNYSKYSETLGDCRFTLAEAKACFGEGNLDYAAKLWHAQTPSKSVPYIFPPTPEEYVSSYLCAFAIAVIVGDLGDFIIEGSRWARHEAANNFAVCALHAGKLDVALTALEDVLRSFGAPAVVDSVAAGNLKTLYELCRTPDNMRLIN